MDSQPPSSLHRTKSLLKRAKSAISYFGLSNMSKRRLRQIRPPTPPPPTPPQPSPPRKRRARLKGFRYIDVQSRCWEEVSSAPGDSPNKAPFEFDWFLYENGIVGSMILTSHDGREETAGVDRNPSSRAITHSLVPSLEISFPPPLSPISLGQNDSPKIYQPRQPQDNPKSFSPLSKLIKFRQVQRHQISLHPTYASLIRCWDLFTSLPIPVPPTCQSVTPCFNNPEHRAKIADYIFSADIPYLLSDAAYPCFLREWCPQVFIPSEIEHILLEGKNIQQICADSWALQIHDKLALHKALTSVFSKGDAAASQELVLECLEVTWGQGVQYLVMEGELEGWVFFVKDGRAVRGRSTGFLEGMERFLESLVGYYEVIAGCDQNF